MLRADNLSKIYKKQDGKVIAINNLSLDIPTGDFVAIVGPSGSGKSSLLLMLGGMLFPTEGEVIINGESIYQLTLNEIAKLRQQQLGFIFQTFHLIPYLTALENVQMPMLLKGLSSKEQAENAESLLEKVGLSDRMDHKPSELSVGQQQRIALARMLANNPSIILADEPTGNLDSETGQRMIQFFFELNAEGRTVVLVTHDIRVAEQAKNTITISNGTISG